MHGWSERVNCECGACLAAWCCVEAYARVIVGCSKIDCLGRFLLPYLVSYYFTLLHADVLE